MFELQRLIPDAPQALCELLASAAGSPQPPIRSEIFGLQRFAQHGRSLGETHTARTAASNTAFFFPRLQDNIKMLRQAHRYIGVQAATGYDISPAAEWLLDNFHLIESQLKEIREGLPRRYFRALPVLQGEPLAGLPRIYGVAWAFVAHTDGAFDEELLAHFLGAYQETRELTLGEMWALPTTLRVLLIENLRRLAERVATHKAAREVANLCCDHLERYPLHQLVALLALLNQRGVGEMFLAQMVRRLRSRQTPELAQINDWLQQELKQPAAVRAQQSADQAANNLSVSNAIGSLRAIGDADWPNIVAESSALMRVMLAAPLFRAEDTVTRDQTLHGIERLARRSGRSEVQVAEALSALMQDPAVNFTPGVTPADTPGAPVISPASGAAHWLHGSGRPALAQALGFDNDWVWRLKGRAKRWALAAYLGSLLLGTLGLLAWVGWASAAGMRPYGWASVPPGWWWAAVLMLLPASETVVAVVNRLISESARPRHLPRLALADGIPPEHRVLVVMPCMLSNPLSSRALAHRLHLHHLANPEHEAQFALLSDWADAATEQTPQDSALLSDAAAQLASLNQLYPTHPGQAPRFILLHRQRRFSESEQAWIGWERKRGKLEALVAALATQPEGGQAGAFIDLGPASQLAPRMPYIVTLDSDTELPPGRLRELVGIAAHPQNQPQLHPSGRWVQRGYGILQPRVATPLPAAQDFTPFHWLFAGQCGIDPYSAASSEVYQDLFGEGSFSGKGLLNVQAVHAALGARLPDGQVLSHDLLEGSLARCAAATDITVIEDAPFHADVAASRLHRWTRGDWQLLPFLLRPQTYPLRTINRWKMFDNLRRSLVAPFSLALLVLCLALSPSTLGLSAWAALALVLAAFTAGPLMGALAGLAPSTDHIAKRHFYRGAGADLARALLGGLWHLVQLLPNALMSIDAVLRALWRMTVSRRRLLQWTTAAAAQAAAQSRLAGVLRVHALEPVLSLLVFAGLWAAGSTQLGLAAVLCGLWALAPFFTWWASRSPPAGAEVALPAAEQDVLEGIARDSWRYFERVVGPEDRHLPPDNLQTTPYDMLAHRTSPTNIGLYMLSVACARQFGWIGTQDLLQRLQATLDSLATLERHRGHFLNWYDTRTGAPLLPRYVSSVDSGNLSGHLLAVAQACRELAEPAGAAAADQAVRRALARSRSRLAALLARWPQLLQSLAASGARESALAQILALADPDTEPKPGASPVPSTFDQLLPLATDELLLLWPPVGNVNGNVNDNGDGDGNGNGNGNGDGNGKDTSNNTSNNTRKAAPAEPPVPNNSAPPATSTREHLVWQLADHLATLRSAWLDARSDDVSASETTTRLLHLATRCEALAWEPDFHFLYHPRRRLLHLGFRVAEQELDAGFYDLLASESRLTSLLAIAKADVPVGHWAALGRPFHAVGSTAALRSWSGSMFEYLMPSLVLAEPQGSVLNGACCAAVAEQITFGRSQQLPWGMSESAYAAQDTSLAYQYAPQGVPRLALRRTPPEDRVVAPYATALAAQVAPRRAGLNFGVLQVLGARQRYGYIEALDFSAQRQAAGVSSQAYTPVSTFMAHHQGMSIVALANVLLDKVAQRWGMANAHIQAVASLLHERAPREVPAQVLVPAGPQVLGALALQSLQNRPPGLLRDVLPGANAIEPSHVLSNGSYSVTLRANGAGYSRRRGVGITRWRDDALRDQLGSFFYLRLRAGGGARGRPMSITQHPAPDPEAQYSATFHADRVCFDAAWPRLRAHTTVWVSPEDDIEFRQVDLHNSQEREIEVELLSAFEVTLADPRADDAHPAFSNLFVSAEWRPAAQALVFERRPRQGGETVLSMAHFLAHSDTPVSELRVEADRLFWAGRNQAASQPRAKFRALPVKPGGTDAAVGLDTGMDPVCAMAVRLRIKAHSQARLTFATAASTDPGTLSAVLDKYRQASHVQRASLMSATLMGIRLRGLHLSAASFAAIQSLSTALLLTLSRPGTRAAGAGWPDSAASGPQAIDRKLLWRLGISGERPIILVSTGALQGLTLIRSLAQGMRLWSWGGMACDLVVVNAEAASYEMSLHREIAALRDRHASETSVENLADKSAGPALTALHLLRAEELSPGELATLHSLARVHLQADGRPLVHHVQAWVQAHEDDFEQRHAVSTTALPVANNSGAPVATSQGRFVAGTGEFEFDVSALMRPARPWVNVLANPGFGSHVSETGGGHSWAVNSRLNQITAWSNDPLADPTAEWLLLQDRKSGALWSATPSAGGDPQSRYRVVHGQGRTQISHRVRHFEGKGDGDVEVRVEWCVDRDSAVKHLRVQIHNRSQRSLQWRVIGLVEWQLGAQRAERGQVHTALLRQRLAKGKLSALLATQQDHWAGFGGGTAFFALSTDTATTSDGKHGAAHEASASRFDDELGWTCDRREFFDARGHFIVPDHFGQRSGAGLDPCAALSSPINLPPGGQTECVYLMGYAASPDAARQLAIQAAATPAAARLAAVQQQWSDLLQTTQVQTPDPLFDALVNHWLLYQTVACRLWAKAGFYQAGGATGFRDQLQDTLALAWAQPSLLREQILRCAARQFAAGDVQHWWHAPGGAGVRTHFSDDLLWLAWACVHYLRCTADESLLEEVVPFIEGAAIPPGAEDVYEAPSISAESASVFEHAARTLDRSLAVGAHGLPLMGTGDWNDGMNRVGHEGRGESVWLAFFLCKLAADFAPLAQARGQSERAQRWLDAASGWRAALQGPGWDGEWYRRAYFDDGSPLGASANPEARIDLIAQAWAVLSNAAPRERQVAAMASAQTRLVDDSTGLIHLLDPPLQHATPSAGYIQAYPPGVRENGGQYSHGGVWALMAQAQLLQAENARSGEVAALATEAADRPYRMFTYLSPAHRAAHPVWGPAYGLEPYVLAGDVYTQAPFTGRGGWSWYTGAAAWMHRAAVESIFGLQLTAHDLRFVPSLPAAWPRAEITLRRDARVMRFILQRGSEAEVLAANRALKPHLLKAGESLAWTGLVGEHCYVIAL